MLLRESFFESNEEIKEHCPFDVYSGIPTIGSWQVVYPSKFTAGGTAHIKIQKADSRIIVDSLFHK